MVVVVAANHVSMLVAAVAPPVAPAEAESCVASTQATSNAVCPAHPHPPAAMQALDMLL